MPYVPDATDPTEPVDSQKASSMGLEFRTLKAYIQSVIVPSIAANIGSTGGIFAGQLVGVQNGSAFIARPPNESSYAAISLQNSIGTRQLEFMHITAGAVPAYGAGAGDTVINSNSGNLTISTVDTARMIFGNTGTITIPAPSFLRVADRVRAGYGGAGYVTLNAGDGTRTGYLEFYNGTDVRKSYIGYGLEGSGGATYAMQFVTVDGSAWNFNTAVYAPTFYGSLIGSATDALSVPWTGVVGRPTHLSQFVNDIGAGGGSSGVSSVNGRVGAVVVQSADVTGALGYTPYNSANPSGYTTLAAVASAGYQTASGSVATAGSANSVSGVASNGYGNRTVSTSAPSGGANGDIWYRV